MWGIVRKAINNNAEKPLNALIDEVADIIIQKLENDLDLKVSSRQESWGATTLHKDRIDESISSRASQSDIDALTGKVNNLENSISQKQRQVLEESHADKIDDSISSRASQATVNEINGKIDSMAAGGIGSEHLDRIDVNIGSRATQATAEAIKAKTDLIEASPITSLHAGRIDVSLSSRASQVIAEAIKNKTDLIEANPMTVTHASRIDAAISSRQANWGATTTHRDRIDATISSRASQASINALQTSVNNLSSGGGGVKGVQRGTFRLNNQRYIDITISPVSPNKCHVSLYGNGTWSERIYDENAGIHVNVLLTNRLTVDGEAKYGMFSWEIVEYN